MKFAPRRRRFTRLLCALLFLGVACRHPASPPEVTGEAAEAAYDAKHYDECAREFRVLADRGGAWSRGQHLYNAACCDARGGHSDAAFATLAQAAAAGYGQPKDPDLESLHGDARWPAYLESLEAAQAAAEKSIRKDLRDDLRARSKVDQDARNEILAALRAGSKAPDLWDKVIEIDHENTEALKALVATYGWPGKSLVGMEGAQDAWLLAQHADKDHAFQKQVLALLEPLVARGEVNPSDYGYLYDRVAVAEQRPQRFATQLDDSGDPGPLEDPAHLDARRAAFGMTSFAAYKAVHLEHSRK